MGKVRESQRRAADAWDAKNMLTIGCKMRREIAEDFKQYATERQTTPSALIKAYVLQCLGRTDDTPEPAQEDPDPQQVTECISECLRLIQRVAEENQPNE